ncbi:MAG TPA: hypothetical protein VK158_04975 [Acidobacteriota bacterium]|nr:hypothetical protein [Acidobacteriota bacterium]
MRQIIGIAGPSCSGKTTVAKRLAQELLCDIVSLDNQYILGSPKIYVGDTRTMERPQLYDGQKLADIANLWKQNGRATFQELDFATKKLYDRTINDSQYLVLEGFLLLTYPQIRNACSHTFYIDISWNEIVRRRIGRGRETPEKIDAFLRVGRQEMEQYVFAQKSLPGVTVLNGSSSIDDTVREIKKRL